MDRCVPAHDFEYPSIQLWPRLVHIDSSSEAPASRARTLRSPLFVDRRRLYAIRVTVLSRAEPVTTNETARHLPTLTANIAAYNEDAETAVTSIEAALEIVRASESVDLKYRVLSAPMNFRIVRHRGMSEEQHLVVRQDLLVLATQTQNAQDIATSRGGIVAQHMTLNRIQEAVPLLEEALARLEELGASELLWQSRNNLLLARCLLGEFDAALPRMRTIIRDERRVDFRREIGDCISAAACIASARGDGSRAARLHGAAEVLRQDAYATGELGNADAELVMEEESFARARALLGDDNFDRDFMMGQALSKAEACDLALQP